KIPNPVPDCPPPFFSQFKNQPSPPAPIHLHRSTSGPSRIHPFPKSEVRAKLQTSSTFEFQSLYQLQIKKLPRWYCFQRLTRHVVFWMRVSLLEHQPLMLHLYSE
ncbi:hypothetical protein ES332_D05G029500v1, partial [Gossypium tomentosum]